MAKVNLKELKAAVESATPGPWACEDMFEVITTVEQDFDVAFPPICLTDLRGNTELGDKRNDDNAKYIALFNPVTVRVLIECLEMMREALKEIHSLKGMTNLGDCCVDKACAPAFQNGKRVGHCQFSYGVNRGFNTCAGEASEALAFVDEKVEL